MTPLYSLLGDPFPNVAKELHVHRGPDVVKLLEVSQGGPSDHAYDLSRLFGDLDTGGNAPAWRDCWLHLYHNFLLDFHGMALSDLNLGCWVEQRLASGHQAGPQDFHPRL